MIVLDTHVLVWWVSMPDRLSARARRALSAVGRDDPAVASAISVFEIATAVRRGRLELGVPLADWLGDLLQLPDLRIEPIGAPIAHAAGALPDAMVGDPADRIIAATALALDVGLVTADAALRRAVPNLKVIW